MWRGWGGISQGTNSEREIMKFKVIVGLVAVLAFCGCSDNKTVSSESAPKSISSQAATPPAGFDKAKLFFAFGDKGDPAPSEMAVEEVTKPFIDKGVAKWSKLSETEWMLDINSEDKVTNKKSNMRLVFDKQARLNGDVLLKRLVANGEDASQQQIVNFLTMVKESKQ